MKEITEKSAKFPIYKLIFVDKVGTAAMNNSASLVLELLQSIPFPKCRSRKNVADEPVQAFVLGTINLRGQKKLGGKTRGPSRYNDKFPELFKAIRELIEEHDPNFEYTTVQVNKNVCCAPHVDKNNVGPSYIIALGDYSGGGLCIEGDSFDIHNNFHLFDGRLGHWVEPFTGERYSLVYFTHTFKPPHVSLHRIKVTEHGLYNKGKLVKQYSGVK